MGLHFALSGALAMTLVVAALLPLLLLPITRILALRGRNPRQFALALGATLVLWLLLVILVPAVRPADAGEVVVAVMILTGAALVYLEIWGLMSRGYTLSILIALLDGPLDADAIARTYRGGDGLDWILRHRLGGLEGARAITRTSSAVRLTEPRGLMIARLYGLSIAILGLRKTG